MSQICCFSWYSDIVFIPSSPRTSLRVRGVSLVHIHLIENARAKRIHGFCLRQKRHGRFPAFAEADAAAVARLQVVVNDHILAVRFAILPERLKAIGHADDPARLGQAWMPA